MSNIRFTISVRGKKLAKPVLDFLAENFGDIPVPMIDSVFGFCEKSTLYGGRPYYKSEISDLDTEQLYGAGIGVRLPLTNHYIEPDEYETNKWLLEKYHRPGNAVIITNDNLAHWIREDFPQYRVEASVIKNIHTYSKIEEALKLYDTVILPMEITENLDFLGLIENKDRITLFANAGCALTCPSKMCYPSFSTMNKFKGGSSQCSRTIKERELIGMIDFDLEPLVKLGFTRFKLLRGKATGITGF